MYSELALANYCSVQMLFHKDIEKLPDWSFKREKCHFHDDSTSCKLPEFPVEPKSRLALTRLFISDFQALNLGVVPGLRLLPYHEL